MTTHKKEENDFEVIFLLAAGVLGALYIGAPVYYIYTYKVKGIEVEPIKRGLTLKSVLIGTAFGLASLVYKALGYTFLYQIHKVPTWVPLSMISSNLILLGVAEVTRPIWIKLPFYKKLDKRESVF